MPDASLFGPGEGLHAATVPDGSGVNTGAQSGAVIRMSGSLVGHEMLAAKPVVWIMASRFLTLLDCQAVAVPPRRGLIDHTKLFMRKVHYETA